MSILHHAPASRGGRRIFIAIPSYGDLPALTAFSLFESRAAISDVEIELYILCGHCHVDDARNMCVDKFLKSDADEFMFIDADIGWFAEDLARFLNHDRDVVAAVYRKKGDEEDYPCQLIPGEIWADSDGLIEVHAVPTGFLKIKRHVLEAMSEKFPKFRPDSKSDKWISEIFCRSIDVQGSRVSGDINFCHRWRVMGGKIYVDPELVLEHSGEKRWSGSFGSFLRRSNGLDLIPGIQRIKNGTFDRKEVIQLWDEWGHNDWTASHELVAASIDIARQAKGPIIECGSGLTSLVMAAAGAEVHALEHDPVWLSKVLSAKERLDLPNLHVHFAPLENHWYSGYSKLPWKSVDIVLCDGPPRQMSDRDILFKVMEENGCRPRMIIKDDTMSLSEISFDGYEFEIIGELRRFAIGRRKVERKVA